MTQGLSCPVSGASVSPLGVKPHVYLTENNQNPDLDRLLASWLTGMSRSKGDRLSS